MDIVRFYILFNYFASYQDNESLFAWEPRLGLKRFLSQEGSKPSFGRSAGPVLDQHLTY